MLGEPWRLADELTETMKLCRGRIEEKYAGAIESLYPEGDRERTYK